MNQTYISYVVQSSSNHVHNSAIIDLPKSTIALYADNTSQEVIKWANEQ